MFSSTNWFQQEYHFGFSLETCYTEDRQYVNQINGQIGNLRMEEEEDGQNKEPPLFNPVIGGALYNNVLQVEKDYQKTVTYLEIIQDEYESIVK